MLSPDNFRRDNTPVTGWFQNHYHTLLSTMLLRVVLSTVTSPLLSSSKEEEERESYAIALSPLVLSTRQIETRIAGGAR